MTSFPEVLDCIKYTSEDFHMQCINTASKFDKEVCSKWEHAMKQGYFKYDLSSVETRIIPGKLRFFAQLNEKRFTQRRKPQMITSLDQPFDPEKFNFTKVHDKEILTSISAQHRENKGKHIIVINVSPLEYGNILFVPDCHGQLPQILTEACIHLCLEMVLLSNKKDFRIGFNSLCAFASVNHLHLHAFFSSADLPVENVELSRISNEFYETVDYPIKAFVFQCNDIEHVAGTARSIYQMTNYLHQNNIAHNVFFTRGPLNANTLQNTGLRVFIWPRKANTGVKDETVFNIAVYELAGFLPIKERSWFNNMTENDVCNYFKEAALDDTQYLKIKSDVLKILAHKSGKIMTL